MLHSVPPLREQTKHLGQRATTSAAWHFAYGPSILEFRYRQASLKLHFIYRHDTSPCLNVPILTPVLAHQMNSAVVS
uniref:Uncharacterized protein n=1 Tax=mine drainage metagenome TaxID=410659 RepID=E6QQ92_9ZZZZ